MQLFLTNYIQDGNLITITEERVVHQLSKVLRAKKGDEIAVQWDDKRVVAAITDINKEALTAEIIKEEQLMTNDTSKCLAVALPNKFDKLELIVQKCTEIGIDQIIFFPAKHSILKEISDAKMERLKKISLEAVEQSRGKKFPLIIFQKNIYGWGEGKRVFVAHQEGTPLIENKKGMVEDENGNDVIVMVGPEGGRHAEEEEMFKKLKYKKISFGENILRTETAAIIGARMIKNSL